MNQANLCLDLTTKETRKREFLEEMERVVTWAELVAFIEPHSPRAKTDRAPPFPIQTMPRIHFMQQWFGLSDPAMEEVPFDVQMYREFAQLPDVLVRLPDESTILRFRHLLEKRGLAVQMFAAMNARLGAKGLMLKTGSVPVILVPGHRPSQEAKCLSLGNLPMSVPVSLMTTTAVVTSMPSMRVRSTPHIWNSLVRRSNFGELRALLRFLPGSE